MLILSRKPNESIVIDGRIIVKVIRFEGETVKIGIQAPSDVPVHRQEIYDEIQSNNQQAVTTPRPLALRIPVRRPTKQEPPQKTAAVKPHPAITQNKNTANT
jgi:carbon storage regulator